MTGRNPVKHLDIWPVAQRPSGDLEIPVTMGSTPIRVNWKARTANRFVLKGLTQKVSPIKTDRGKRSTVPCFFNDHINMDGRPKYNDRVSESAFPWTAWLLQRRRLWKGNAGDIGEKHKQQCVYTSLLNKKILLKCALGQYVKKDAYSQNRLNAG